MIKNKKSIAMETIIMMVIGLVILAMMIYLANKYILGTGKTAGELSGCEGQGGKCEPSNECTECKSKSGKSCTAFKNMGGCSESQYCCIPSPI